MWTRVAPFRRPAISATARRATPLCLFPTRLDVRRRRRRIRRRAGAYPLHAMAAFTAAISPPSPKAFLGRKALGDDDGPRAGHTPYTASWTATLTRSGQIHSWRANSSPPGKRPGGGVPLPTHMRPSWNERIPVWERRIPQWETSLGAPVGRAPPGARTAFNPYASEMSTASSAQKSVRWRRRATQHPLCCYAASPLSHACLLVRESALTRRRVSRKLAPRRTS